MTLDADRRARCSGLLKRASAVGFSFEAKTKPLGTDRRARCSDLLKEANALGLSLVAAAARTRAGALGRSAITGSRKKLQGLADKGLDYANANPGKVILGGTALSGGAAGLTGTGIGLGIGGAINSALANRAQAGQVPAPPAAPDPAPAAPVVPEAAAAVAPSTAGSGLERLWANVGQFVTDKGKQIGQFATENPGLMSAGALGAVGMGGLALLISRLRRRRQERQRA